MKKSEELEDLKESIQKAIDELLHSPVTEGVKVENNELVNIPELVVNDAIHEDEEDCKIDLSNTSFTTENINTCNICDFLSDNVMVLIKHYEQLHSMNYCMICEMKCVSQSHLNVHINAAHPSLISGKCTQSVAELKSTMNFTYSASDQLYTCKFCDKVADKLCHMIMHIRSHTGERPYACEQCDYQCSSMGSLKNHILYSHSNLPISILRPFQCDTCKKSFRNKSSLNKHKLVHKEKKDFMCGSCSYSCRTMRQLKEHELDNHSGLSDLLVKPYACEKCNFRFKHPGHLTRHLKVHSKDITQSNQIKCEYCDSEFTEKYNLKVHIRTKHEIGDPLQKFLCTVCNKQFKRIRDLKLHAIIHQANAVDHNCPHCDFKSKHIKSVSRHIKSKHLYPEGVIKKFLCTVCKKGFESNAKLKRHSDVHKSKSERCLSCPECKYTTVDKYSFIKHSREVHESPDIA